MAYHPQREPERAQRAPERFAAYLQQVRRDLSPNVQQESLKLADLKVIGVYQKQEKQLLQQRQAFLPEDFLWNSPRQAHEAPQV